MTPPALARWILSRTLPAGDRRMITADLEEEFARVIVPSRSPWSARAWYWRQVIASLPGAARMRGRGLTRDLWRDLGHGARLLVRNPTFALAAILTLTLGIAATTAVLTIGNAVLARPLPYREPDRVLSIAEIDRAHDGGTNVSWPDFLDYQQQNRTLESLAGYNGGSRTLIVPGRSAERVSIAGVTGQFFDVLGVQPALGRAFTDADGVSGAPPVVLITDGAWRVRFGGDPAIVGRLINLNGSSTTIIGVLPPDFAFPPRGLAELWLPLRPSTAQIQRKYFHWMQAVGRLRPGMTVAQASEDLDAIARSFAKVDPRNHANSGVRVMRLSDRIVGDVRPIIFVLLAAAGFVLLAACANIAGLLMAQGSARAAEMNVRAALGASRWRLVRQLLSESLALALPGGIAGLACGQWAVGVFIATIPAAQRASLPNLSHLGLDWTAVLMSAGVTCVAAGLFGLAPALRAAGRRLELGTRGAVGSGRRDLRLQSGLIVLQVALAMVLLFGAGLLTSSVRRLLDVSPGFPTDRLATMSINLSGARYGSADAVRVFHDDVMSRVAALPGVAGVATIDQPPLFGAGNSGDFTVRGSSDTTAHSTALRTVSANYFDLMGVPLVSGRAFAASDTPATPPVVIINRLLADQAFGGAAVGQRVSFPFLDGNPALEIVGVVGNESLDAIDQPLQPALYFAYGQGPSGAFNLMVRASGDPAAVVPAVRAEVARVDANVPVYGAMTMNEVRDLAPAVFQRRTVLLLMAGFAAVAMLLAAVGLYGVLAQHVATRSREIGVRLALGASGRSVAGAVLRRGLIATAIGLLAGAGGSVIIGRALSGLLFHTAPTDARILAAVLIVLATAAAIACVVPCRRALGVNPVDALRGD